MSVQTVCSLASLKYQAWPWNLAGFFLWVLDPKLLQWPLTACKLYSQIPLFYSIPIHPIYFFPCRFNRQVWIELPQPFHFQSQGLHVKASWSRWRMWPQAPIQSVYNKTGTSNHRKSPVLILAIWMVKLYLSIARPSSEPKYYSALTTLRSPMAVHFSLSPNAVSSPRPLQNRLRCVRLLV